MTTTRAILSLTLTGSIAAGASAAQLLTFYGMAANKYWDTHIKVNGTSRYVYAGAQNVSVAGYNGGAHFDAYCVDLDNTQSASFNVDILSTNLLTNGGKIAWLFNNYAGTITDGKHGAALQLAIWETLIDGGTDVNSGNFQYTDTGAVATQIKGYAATYLTGVGTSVADYFKATTQLGSRNQNLVGGTPTGPVPEPFTLSLAAAGLVAAARRRRNRTTS